MEGFWVITLFRVSSLLEVSAESVSLENLKENKWGCFGHRWIWRDAGFIVQLM